MTELEKALLDEVELLQTEILRLQDVIESKQNENKELSEAYESLQQKRTTLYYDDLESSFKQNLESILSSHKSELDKSENKLESLESEQKQIEAIKTELNQLLESGKSDCSTVEYQDLKNKYESLQKDYNSLESELLTIRTTLKTSLVDMETEFQKAYSELTDNMAENLENAWKEKLKKLLPLVDMRLNEN